MALPQEILTNISMHVFLPEEVKTKAKGEVMQLQPAPTVDLEDSAKLASLMQLKQEIEHFLSPLDEFLDCLVFFHMHKSNLFFQYVNFHLKKFKEEQSLSPRMSEFHPVYPSNRDMLVSAKVVPVSVAHAVKEAVFLIDKLLEGSATYFEITLDESLYFSDRDIELEFGPLKWFAEISGKTTPKQNCLNGVKDFLGLQSIAEKILIISAVCEMYELQGCTSDTDFVSILRLHHRTQKTNHSMI